MALVTKTLHDLLAKHVQRHGTVVWYDPEGNYNDVAGALSPQDVAGAVVYRYEPTRGFLALRRALEPHWNDANQPPRLIIYVPLERGAGHHALIEFEVAGVVLQPAQQPPEQNTALTEIARQALSQVFPVAKVEELVTQTGKGQLSLVNLDALAEKGLEGQSGLIVTIFGTGNAPDVALRFLADTALDADITTRNADMTLAALLTQTLGVAFTAEKGLPTMRNHLARLVLSTDFITALGPDTPQPLRTLPLADSTSARQAAVQLAQQWRNRLDGAKSYRRLSQQVEHEVNPATGNISLDSLAKTETFRAAEIKLQTAVEQALRHKATAQLVELAETRLNGFWSNQDPLIKTRWEVIVAAGRVLLHSSRIDAALKGKQWPAETLISRYAYGETGEMPWCLLDTAQRHLERDFNRFELDPHQHETLQQLVSKARQNYAATAGMLADRFLRAYTAAKFESGALLPQTDIFQQTLAAASKVARIAYVLVDALRYEMALELKAVLESEWLAELTPALATPPTITEIGMAALMPGAEKGITITATDKGKLTPLIDGTPLSTRQARVTYFERLAGGKSVTAKLEQLAPLTSNQLTNRLKAADLILVTATDEIDGLCENNPSMARRMLDDVLNQLRRGIKTLFGLGFNQIVITADHGYLFGDEISIGQTIDAPGGETIALKRRVWIGKGGREVPGTLRRPLSAFGIGGDLELVTPYELGIFKVPGGATSYFHGGLSLPELVIPVLTVRSDSAQPEEAGAKIIWKLMLGSPAITTRFMSVTIEGQTQGLLPIVPPVVSIEVQAGTDTVSVPISATYGFQIATKDVTLKTVEDDPRRVASNTITLQITDEPNVATVTVQLLDATTGVSLTQIDNVPLDIAF